MNRYPARRPLGHIEGLTIHTSPKAPLHRRRWVWFYLGCAATATLAGFLAGLLP